jgi:hypothetical protein
MNKQEILVSKYTKIIHPQDIGKETSVLENTLRNLIEEARQRERERIIEEIEKMRKNLPKAINVEIDLDHGYNAIKGLGYNQAIEDIIETLKQ